MRALMGFGEAGFTSIAPTVLGDLYSPEDRTVVLALFYYAIPVGRYEHRPHGRQLANFRKQVKGLVAR